MFILVMKVALLGFNKVVNLCSYRLQTNVIRTILFRINALRRSCGLILNAFCKCKLEWLRAICSPLLLLVSHTYVLCFSTGDPYFIFKNLVKGFILKKTTIVIKEIVTLWHPKLFYYTSHTECRTKSLKAVSIRVL
jgi:hypothetical protein